MEGKKQWTVEQQAAIDYRGQNLLVSAGAGSGKTAVLVERILQRVLDPQDPVDINRLLVVTFTNAAAAEMRQRIGAALLQKLRETKDSASIPYLQKQLSLLNIASITTLHSFCLDLLKEHYLLAHLDAKFSIVNEIEKALLVEEVLDRLLEEQYREKAAPFLDLVNRYGGREDELVRKIILELYQFSLSQPEPLVWLDTLANLYQTDTVEKLANSSWYVFLRQQCEKELQEAVSFLDKAISVSGQPEGPASYLFQLAEEKQVLQGIISSLQKENFDGYQVFSEISFATLRSKGKCDSVLKERAKNYRDKSKAIVLHWKNNIFVLSLPQCLDQMAQLLPVVKTLVELTKLFYEKLQAQKAKKAWVDFSDLEHFALQLLRDKENGVALSLQHKFAEVLVDEYQDINHAQEAILKIVSRENNRFLVGDVKQSIYRFRLAEPGLFLQKYAAYSKAQNGVKIDLSVNFRSQAEILNGINFIFAQLMHSSVTEIDYDKNAYLVPQRRSEQPYPIELDIIDVKQAKENEAEDTSGAQREARYIGKRILELVDDGYQYRDIVILLRSTKNWAGIFQEEFQLLGIPCYAEINAGYFDAPEISLICSVLQVIDNPYQDIPLAAVLLSVLGNFTPDELATIRVVEKGQLLYDGLLAMAHQESISVLQQKVKNFLRHLEELRYFAMQHPVADLVEKIYQEEQLYHWVGLLPGGTQRQANLKSFYQRAKDYDTQSYRGLYGFISFIDKIQRSGNDLSLARTLSEQESVVRIMSVHHSKGLEFPVVFVAGLGRKFNMQDTRGDILLHRDLGMGIVDIDGKNHVKYQTLPKIAIMEKIKQETLGEELRILYVALTRARDRLFLVGSCANLEKSVQNWAEGCDTTGFLLESEQIRSAKSPLDWVARAVIRHRDGAILLNQTLYHADEIAPEVYGHDSLWKVQIYHSGEEAGLLTEDNLAFLDCFAEKKAMAETAYGAEIKKQLSWQYPWTALAGREGKLSVTELQEKLKEPQPVSPNLSENKEQKELGTALPAKDNTLSLEKEKIDWRYRGTMHHFILEHLVLSPRLTAQEIKMQIAEMIETGVLPQALIDEINYQGIYRFFDSEIGKQILQAEAVYRELSFLCEIPASVVYSDVPETEQIILQGTIDLVFLSPEGWVIVDYKSGAQDYGASEQDIIKKYGQQVLQYSIAFAKIVRQPVIKKYIYLLQQGRFVEITL